MERELLVGPGGAGKTEKLWQRYRSLAWEDRTDSILVLLWNARDVKAWRERMDLPWAGPLHVYTYFGWVQREIRAFWPELCPTPGELEPEFLTVETAQFAMLRHVRDLQDDFAGLVTSPERLAIQLGSCLVMASLNGINHEEIGPRLSAAMPAKDRKVFMAAQTAINRYSSELNQAGTLDYGLAVALYSQLLKDPRYRSTLRSFKHLLVDDTGEQPPSAHALIETLLEYVQSATLSFSTDGGHAGFFGADAKGAWQKFGRIGPVVPVRPQHCQWLGCSGALYRSVLTGTTPRLRGRGPRVEMIHQDLRSELLDKAGERLVSLADTAPPGEIAVIAPMVDKVMEHALSVHLGRAGIPLNVLAKNRRLIDEPYVRALMTLALLAHPHWELDWGVPDLAQSLQLLLKVDPVRAWLLSRQVRECRLLPLEVWQRERVGFRAAQGYDLLREWLNSYKQGSEQPIDLFFQRVFGELLSRLPPARDDLVVCRQLMVSARKFLSSARRIGPHTNPGAAFIGMLSAGTVAAESLLEPSTREQAIVLTTPYAYISGHFRSRIQVWLDCTSGRWFQQDVREIINPHVLKKSWREGDLWTDDVNTALSLGNGARVVRALMRRCGDLLVVGAANIDSQGFEQNGVLLEAVYSVLAGEEGNGDAVSSRSEGGS